MSKIFKTLLLLGTFGFTSNSWGDSQDVILQGVYYKNLKVIFSRQKSFRNFRGKRRLSLEKTSTAARRAAVNFCKGKAPNTEMNAFVYDRFKISDNDKSRNRKNALTEVFCSEKKANPPTSYQIVLIRNNESNYLRSKIIEDWEDLLERNSEKRYRGFDIVDVAASNPSANTTSDDSKPLD